jgi:hypothetical protein
MKKVMFLFLIVFVSCFDKEKRKIIINDSEIVNNLPIGKELLISDKLPNKITYEYDKDGNPISNNNLLDSINNISGNFYENLKIDLSNSFKLLPQVKKGIIYNKPDKAGMIYYLDSCYYAKTIFNDGKFKLRLFKDGNKYRSKLGNENISIVNYLVLASYKSDILVDYKIIYFNESFLYANNSRCFYLDKKLNLHLKDYSSDEEETSILLEKCYHIDINGKFIPQPTTKITSTIIDEKVNLTNKIPVGSWRDDCSSNYRYFQIDEENNNNITLAMEPNNFYVILEEIKDKRKDGKFFYKIKYAEGIGANDVFSKDFINDKEVITIQVIDKNSIEFKWLGYFDNISKKRINTECPFGEKSCDEKPIILRQCEFEN